MAGHGPGLTGFVLADLSDPDSILHHPAFTATLDITEPVGVLMLAVLMHLDSWEHPHRAVSKLMAQLPPGSCLAVTHLTGDYDPAGVARLVAASQQQGTAVVSRTRGEVEEFFAGLELIPPGVVPVTSLASGGPGARRGRAGRYVQPRRCRPQARLARRLAAAVRPRSPSRAATPDRRRSGPHLQARISAFPSPICGLLDEVVELPILGSPARAPRPPLWCRSAPDRPGIRSYATRSRRRVAEQPRQFPCGLLSMLCHSTPTRRLAGMPL